MTFRLLARIWALVPAMMEPLAVMAPKFVDSFTGEEKGVATVEDALEGARHIVAEMISEDADLRKAARALMFDEGVVVSRKAMDAVDERSHFSRINEKRFTFSIAEAFGQVLAVFKHSAALIFGKEPKADRDLS